ncbi:oxidoreductase [Marmoricola endophyticus]|uniref:Oxidoreductase n=1 Tax=Marmoricola endophyticus TaxID=2040280 RepID=A0A917BMA6_9ACTN|nr:NADP-dependent oxidoreductase [Marmoricola endophyticus]GGF51384.1 oxidoreductase [Marmoricola endophyticus]
MRAVRYHEYGPADVMRIEEAPDPVLAPGAVLVRVEAVSVNPIDWKLRAGLARDVVPLDFPVVPGRDAAGVVQAVGEGVTDVAVGDRVFGLGGVQDTYAELAVLTAYAPVPAQWSANEAASAGLAPATAMGALTALGDIAGRTLLVEGGAGAVGAAVVALAVARGARVVGTARVSEHAVVEQLGGVPVEYGDGLADRVASVASGGVDLVVDTAASGSLAELVRIAGGPEHVVTVADQQRAAGLGVTEVWAENRSEWLRAAVDLADRYTPRVARELPWAEAAEAHRIAERGSTGGKIVLTVR